ncbi:MAG: MerC domain-containing protein [Gammaproteobacteria bacterium]|nr:MerC domain-containing protein [Gammaproteobacteria bacterium]
MSVSRHFDRIAIALSTICIVHCLAVPIVVAVLPVAAITFADDTHFHALMLWLVVPTSAVGFTLGYRVHRRWSIVAFGAVSAAALAAAAILGHAYWRESLELAVNLAASLALAAAHWMNFREVRRLHRHAA